MKTSQTKIQTSCSMYLALRRLERSIFDAYATTVAELDQALMFMENDLERARKERLR